MNSNSRTSMCGYSWRQLSRARFKAADIINEKGTLKMSERAMTIKQFKQGIENATAEGIFNAACNELDAMREYNYNRLRYCSAWVFETENFYLLKSYDTLIAAIDKRSNVTVDVLRMVYGYTSTSAQHISKFLHDYTPYPWNFPRYTWRDIHAVK